MAKLFPTVAWAQGSNIYEVNVRQYTVEGTFAAFREHLPRLQEMGVEILWLMPVTPISVEKRQGTLGSYYACSSYTKINPEFGTVEDFRSLVNDVHARGMKIIIDWVANHTGCDHHWTKEHPEWYYKNEAGMFYDRNGWIDVIDLDYSNAAMREAMIRSMEYWIRECDIDGFRCDMAHLVPLDFWMTARKACDAIKSLFWLAETENIEYHDVFDCTYAWDWMHKSDQFFRGHAPFHEFVHETVRVTRLPVGCTKLMFTSNHDENSWNGTEYEKYGAAAKALAVLSATYQATPLIYSGQELPNEKQLRFFDKDEIAWEKGLKLDSFYGSLLGLRKYSNAVRYGELEILFSEDEIFAFLRKHEERLVLVILNLSGREKARIKLSSQYFDGVFESVFSGLRYEFAFEMEFEPEPWGFIVYHR